MSDNTGIEWTDATWNPITGCTKVSPGCDHCYAETFAERFRGTPGHHFENGFDVTLRPERLEIPLRWKKPRRIFVNSMSDLFHDAVPDEYIARVFAVMAEAGQHTFQILTKRHARMRSLLRSTEFAELLDLACGGDGSVSLLPLPNVWLGVSVENQQWADSRIPALLDTPAVVRFLSCEPLLGPVDLTRITSRGDGVWSALDRGSHHAMPAIDWVIVGGESGHGARPMHPDWARSLRDQCLAAGVPFLYKQWGEWAPAGYAIRVGMDGEHEYRRNQYRPAEHYFPGSPDPRFTHTVMARVGKKAAGRELDGRTWDQYPEPAR